MRHSLQIRAGHPLGMVVALALLAGPVSAQEQQREDPRTVTVNATAEVERPPERATLVLAVESQAGTAQQASQQNATSMERVIAALRGMGIQGAAVRTISYQLNPVYTRAQPGETGQRISGYRAVNMVEVKVDSLPRLGSVIDGAVEAGANRVASLQFELRDPETARLEAIEQAINKAAREAEVVARAAGQRLGPPMNIQTSSNVPYPRPMFADRAMAMEAIQAAPTPIEGGSITIMASVTIVYRLDMP
jgi:uncharacterized protein